MGMLGEEVIYPEEEMVGMEAEILETEDLPLEEEVVAEVWEAEVEALGMEDLPPTATATCYPGAGNLIASSTSNSCPPGMAMGRQSLITSVPLLSSFASPHKCWLTWVLWCP